MESHLGLMLDQGWFLCVNALRFLMIETFVDYCLETHWGLLMVKCLDLIMVSE